MSLHDLLVALAAAHAELTPLGDRLHVTTDRGRLAALLPYIATHKPELRALAADGQLDRVMREASAFEVMLAEGWNDPRWTDVDKLLALVDRPRRSVRVLPIRKGGRR